jgi:hypothetical protein
MLYNYIVMFCGRRKEKRCPGPKTAFSEADLSSLDGPAAL